MKPTHFLYPFEQVISRYRHVAVFAGIAYLLSMFIGPVEAEEKTRSTSDARYEELQTRLAALRQQFEPYLRSLPQPLAVRSQTPLDAGWRSKFEFKNAEEGQIPKIEARAIPKPPDWFREDLDDSAWEKTTVPEWRYQGRARSAVSCILWYRTHFPGNALATAQTSGTKKRIFLVFGGVDWHAQVWLNGKRLGEHTTYCEPFRFDVTDLLKENNTLAVRVIDGPEFGEPRAYWSMFPFVPAEEQRYVRDRARSIPGYRNDDMHIGSGFGIHREVYLETTCETCITSLFARADIKNEQATVTLETDSTAAGRVLLDVQLLPENFEGKAYKTTLACEVPRGPGKQKLTIPMPEMRRWSPDAPCLYRCRATIKSEKAAETATNNASSSDLLDAQDVLFGCRSFELVSEQRPQKDLPEGMFLLNGQPLFLRGTNIQGFNQLWYWNETDRLIDVVLLLKAAHFNVIRACQHVCFPEVRELLDRLGMLSEQDQGSGRPSIDLEKNLPPAAAAVARQCYNNPGVILLSFANETYFDPTAAVEAALAVDPERIIKPISGNVPPRQGPQYPIPKPLWANVIHDYHTYSAWYSGGGKLWSLCAVQKPQRLVTVGEYGAEALDSYETMARHYPSHWRPVPSADTDTLWGHVQVQKADSRQIVGLRGKKPANLGQYIEASQNYQADLLAEVTKGFRLSPRAISGYFQFHYIDVMAANWPKSIVSHDLTPKKAYYAMAQINQPLTPLFQLQKLGTAMELWAANDLPQAFSDCRLGWAVESQDRPLLSGVKTVNVPAFDAVSAGQADLSAIPADVDTVQIRLTLRDSAGKTLARYDQEVFLRVWREQESMFPVTDKEGFTPLFPKDGVPQGWVVRDWADVKNPPPAGAQWKVVNGVLQGSDPRGTWLISEKEYADFALKFEFKLGDRGNSGCGLRFPGFGDPAFDGLELQMVDPRYYPPEMKVPASELTGSLYRSVAPRKQVYKPNDWNAYEVTLKGTKFKVVLNGEPILDVNLQDQKTHVKRHNGEDAVPLKDRPRKGRIGFQELSRGGSHVEIRNARIKEL